MLPTLGDHRQQVEFPLKEWYSCPQRKVNTTL